MTLIACKECGNEVSTNVKVKFYPKCSTKVPKINWWLWASLSLFAAFLGFGAVIGSSPESKQRARARDAIDLYWEEQKRKSFDAGTQRFIAWYMRNDGNRIQ
jgi:hypothetical protein